MDRGSQPGMFGQAAIVTATRNNIGGMFDVPGKTMIGRLARTGCTADQPAVRPPDFGFLSHFWILTWGIARP